MLRRSTKIWNKLFMAGPLWSAGFQNMSAAVGQEGYSAESRRYYKVVWGGRWGGIFTLGCEVEGFFFRFVAGGGK